MAIEPLILQIIEQLFCQQSNTQKKLNDSRGENGLLQPQVTTFFFFLFVCRVLTVFILVEYYVVNFWSITELAQFVTKP